MKNSNNQLNDILFIMDSVADFNINRLILGFSFDTKYRLGILSTIKRNINDSEIETTLSSLNKTVNNRIKTIHEIRKEFELYGNDKSKFGNFFVNLTFPFQIGNDLTNMFSDLAYISNFLKKNNFNVKLTASDHRYFNLFILLKH